jgi:hypothetical protein
MRDDWKPSVEDDPCGRDRGQRSTASLDEEMRQWDELVEEHGLGCWDCDQVRGWLARMREHAT